MVERRTASTTSFDRAIAWRLFTKRMDRDTARAGLPDIQISGEVGLGERVLEMVSIMARPGRGAISRPTDEASRREAISVRHDLEGHLWACPDAASIVGEKEERPLFRSTRGDYYRLIQFAGGGCVVVGNSVEHPSLHQVPRQRFPLDPGPNP